MSVLEGDHERREGLRASVAWLVVLLTGAALLIAGEDGTPKPAAPPATFAWSVPVQNSSATVNATCDGPNRVYVATSGYWDRGQLALVVVEGGCAQAKAARR